MKLVRQRYLTYSLELLRLLVEYSKLLTSAKVLVYRKFQSRKAPVKIIRKERLTFRVFIAYRVSLYKNSETKIWGPGLKRTAASTSCPAGTLLHSLLLYHNFPLQELLSYLCWSMTLRWTITDCICNMNKIYYHLFTVWTMNTFILNYGVLRVILPNSVTHIPVQQYS